MARRRKTRTPAVLAALLAAAAAVALGGLPEAVPPGAPVAEPATVPAEATPEPAADGSGAPSFSFDDGSREPHARLSELDGNLRCGPVFAVLDAAHMGSGERPDISSVKPSGWHQKRYDSIGDGGWLYNRCHLLGDQLWNDDTADWRNLVTGTRQMNVEGMLPVENEVADHLRSTGHLVLYQVTPIFEGDEALCRAVRMEAECLSCDLTVDETVQNAQEGVAIDYTDGSSRKA